MDNFSTPSDAGMVQPFFSGNGEMNGLIQRFNWTKTPLGSPESWPYSLRITLSTILHSPFPMLLFWGEELTCFYNDAFRPILGNDGKHPSILGKNGGAAWPDTWRIVGPLIENVLQKGESCLFEDYLVPIFRNGRMENVYWTFSYSPVRDADGIICGVLVVCTETTGKMTKYHNIVEQSKTPIGIFMGEDLVIEEANRAMLDIWRVGREAIGKRFLEVVPEMQDQGFVELLLDVYRRGETYQGFEAPATFQRDGTTKTIYFNFEYTPFREVNGDITGVIVLATDVTQQVLAKEQLKVVEDEMRVALEAAGLGYWNLDPRTNTFKCNAQTRKLFGLPPGEDLDLSLAIAAIHPEDRKQFVKNVETALNVESGGHFDMEYRVFNADNGTTRHIRAMGQVYFNDQKIAYRFSGTVQDIHENKEAAESIAESEARFRGTFENAAVGISLLDVDGKWQIVNKRLCEILGYTEDELVRISFQQLTHPNDLQKDLALMQEVIDGKRKTYSLEKRYLHKKGNIVWVNLTLSLVRDKEGQPRYTIVVVEDITERKKAGKALRESEERFQAAIAATQGILWTNNAEGQMEGEQHGWAALTGQSFEEYQGYGWARAIHPDDVQPTLDAWAEAVREKRLFIFEHRLRRANGEWGHFSIRAVPLLQKDGATRQWVGVHTDITEQRKAEESFAYQKRLLETVTENTDMALFLMDDRQICVYMNEAAEEMTGFRLDELKGKQLHYFIHHTHPDGRHYPLEECPIDQALPTQMRTKGEEVFVHGDGRFYPVAFTASPIVIDGKPVGTVIEVRDTTEEKKKEQTLKESEERFRTIANDTPAFIFMADADTSIDFLNKQWLEFIGQSFEEAKGKAWAEITHPDDVPPMLDVYSKAVASHQPYQFEIRQRAKDGQYHYVLWKGIPRIGSDGEFKGMLGVGIDVTENRQAVDALRQSEDLFRTFSNNITNLAWIANSDGWIRWYNQRWYDYTGTTLEEMQGWGWEKVHHPGHIHRVLDFVNEAWTKDAPWEMTFPLRRYDGAYRWFLTRAVPIKNAEGKIYRWIGTNTDVHEQVEAQTALRLTKEQLELTFQNVPSGIYLFDSKGHFLYLNDRGAQQLGYGTAAEMLQENNIFTVREKLAAAYEIFDDKGQPITSQDFSSAITFRTHKPSEVLSKHIHKQKGEVAWLWSKSTPLFNDQGEMVMVLTTSTDVTAQQSFTEKLEKEVQQRTRELQASNQDLQQFAHVASHDLKEPVRKIRTFAGRLQSDKSSSLSENGQLFLSKIEASAQRMYDMIDGVLTYSTLSATEEEPAPVDLNEILRQVESDLEVVMQQKNAVISHQNLPVIKGAPVLIHQLFYNLVNNSLKFSRADVPPQILVTAETVRHNNRPFAQITIKDNGIGFEQEQADRIFQTFTRLNAKDKYEGTGLGLSLCKKIVERHGGAIWAKGKPGEGAEVIVQLPCE